MIALVYHNLIDRKPQWLEFGGTGLFKICRVLDLTKRKYFSASHAVYPRYIYLLAILHVSPRQGQHSFYKYDVTHFSVVLFYAI